MHKALPRPGWWHERSRQRRALLDAAVVRLHAALKSYPGFRNALVFGSYARGNVGPTSDLDVLAIVESKERQSRRELLLRERIGAIGVHYDLVALTPAQFERMRERSFFLQALQEGHWLDAT